MRMNVFYDNSDATACSLTNYSLQTTDDGVIVSYHVIAFQLNHFITGSLPGPG